MKINSPQPCAKLHAHMVYSFNFCQAACQGRCAKNPTFYAIRNTQYNYYMDWSAEDEKWMQIALAEAQKAADLEEVPVGAIVVYEGKIIGRGFNRKESDQNPIAHAEMFALQEAAAYLQNWRLLNVTLYCTLEPCPMCAGAMIQARLPRLVYGARDTRFGADGSIVQVLAAEGFNHRVNVTTGVLEQEAADLLQQFFRMLRAKKS